MGKARMGLIVAALTAGATGCTVVGTWRTVTVDQTGLPSSADASDARFDIVVVTFDDQDNFTATEKRDGVRTTRTGAYRFTGFRLTLDPDDGERHVYRARLDVRGFLLLTQSAEGQRVKAKLEKEPF